jgi:hypothetical protein
MTASAKTIGKMRRTACAGVAVGAAALSVAAVGSAQADPGDSATPTVTIDEQPVVPPQVPAPEAVPAGVPAEFDPSDCPACGLG